MEALLNTQKCAKCEITKQICEFSKRISKLNGYRSRCKACEKDDYKTKKQNHVQIDLNQPQTCDKCNISKPLTEFYKRQDTQNGYMKTCKKRKRTHHLTMLQNKSIDQAQFKRCCACKVFKPY